MLLKIPTLLTFFLSLTTSYRFYQEVQIKVDKWIGSADWEIQDRFAEWSTDFTNIPQDALKFYDQGSTIVVSQHITGLGIVCNSSYPVEWIFEQAEYSDEDSFNIVMKTARESTDVNNPRDDRFLAILELFGDLPTVTGKYTCKSVGGGDGTEKSIFVFWDGSSPPYLVLSGKTVHIYSKDNATIVLPCYLSQPDVVEVNLLHENNGTWNSLSGTGVKFDSKIGYTINILKFPGKDMYGRYKCLTEVEGDEVNVIVERGILPNRQFSNVISSNAAIYYDPYKQEIVCCSSKKGKLPSLHNVFCVNPSICRMKEHKLFKVGNNGKKIISENGSCVSDKVYTRDYGVLRCKGEGIDVFRTFYTDFGLFYNERQGLYYSFKDVVPEKMMHLTIHHNAPYFHMQTITVTCEGMNSYFSDGHKWAMRWRNNSITPFSPIEYDDDPQTHGRRDVDVILHWKMLELFCYIPVWNTTEWVKRSVVIDVQKSSPPIISGPLTEEISLVLNETDKLIECKSMAKPTPILRWKKNGEDVPKNMIVLNSNGTSILMIHHVSRDSQAEYKCIARNIAGESSKTIKVFVEDYSGSSSWGTTAAVLVPLLIIAFAATAGALVWKMQLQKKVVDHLSRVVFRDAERQNT